MIENGSGKTSANSAEITGQFIRLRPLRREDLTLVFEWRNSAEVRRFLLSDRLISIEEHYEWFANLENDNRKRVFLIVSREAKPIGVIQLFAIDHQNGHAEWGFYLADPNMRFGGFGAEAEYLILCYAFGELGLQRVYCHTLGSNQPTLALHERFGFRREGVLRRHVRRGDQYEDLVVMAILCEEFQQVRPRLASIFHGLSARQ